MCLTLTFTGLLPIDSRSSRTESMPALLLLPHGSMPHTQQSFSRCLSNSAAVFLGHQLPIVSFFPMANCSIQLPATPDLQPQGSWKVSPAGPWSCCSQTARPAQARAGSQGDGALLVLQTSLALSLQLPCTCFPWQEEALSHHFIFHL